MRSIARVSRIAAAAIATLLVVAGCASLPESSTPQAIGTITGGVAATSVAPPAKGREPDLLLGDFIADSANSSDRHRAARQFLTQSMSDQWDDSAKTVIADKIDILQGPRSADLATYTVRANMVGTLQSGGDYQPADGTFDSDIKMIKVDGEWRIDSVPAGVLVDRSQFLSSYQRKPLYFVAPTGTTLVADSRWVTGAQDQMTNQLVQLLIDGPKQALAPAVQNLLGDHVTVRGAITKADGRTTQVGVGPGGVKMDFGGLQTLDEQSRRLLAAQVIWTLANADVVGPYVLLADGQPLDPSKPDGWSTNDVASLDPLAVTGAAVGLHALVGGTLVAVGESSTTPAPGYFGKVKNLRSAALSADGTLVAGVADTGRSAPAATSSLLIGGYDTTAFPVAEGQTITRPTWGSDINAAWAVVDGTNVIRAVRDPATGQVSVVPVDSTQLTSLGTRITDLRLSRDGVRAALIVDGIVYVSTVVRQSNGVFSLTSPRAIANDLGSDALALDWSTGDVVVIARVGSDVPVVQVTLDGSRMDALPARNLTPPVVSIDASSNTEYVEDSRAVFQRNNADPVGDRLWREVPGLAGVKATPILPG